MTAPVTPTPAASRAATLPPLPESPISRFTAQVYTVADMQAYALAAIEAAQPASPAPLTDEMRRVLVTAEAALADIGDADREPGDDVAWCEARAAEALPVVRAMLKTSAAALASPQVAPAPDKQRIIALDQIDAESKTRYGGKKNEWSTRSAFAVGACWMQVELEKLAAPVQVAPQGNGKPWDTLTALEKAPKLIEELESESERITRYSNSPLDGVLRSAADVLRELTATVAAPVAPQDEARDAARTLTDEQANAMIKAVKSRFGGWNGPPSKKYETAMSATRDELRALYIPAAKPTEPTLPTQGDAK